MLSILRTPLWPAQLAGCKLYKTLTITAAWPWLIARHTITFLCPGHCDVMQILGLWNIVNQTMCLHVLPWAPKLRSEKNCGWGRGKNVPKVAAEVVGKTRPRSWLRSQKNRDQGHSGGRSRGREKITAEVMKKAPKVAAEVTKKSRPRSRKNTPKVTVEVAKKRAQGHGGGREKSAQGRGRGREKIATKVAKKRTQGRGRGRYLALGKSPPPSTFIFVCM